MLKALIIAVSVLLAGCVSRTYGEPFDDSDDYVKAKSLPTVVVPPDLSSAKISEAYNIPPRDGKIGVIVKPPVQ